MTIPNLNPTTLMATTAAAAMAKRNRIVSALRGAFVADAASMGTHWIYDPKEMAKTVPSVSDPEFLDPPSPRFYSSEEFPGHYGTGTLSPFGEQLLFVTEYVASLPKHSGDLTGDEMSVAMLEWAETFGGRPDHALIKFVANMKKEDQSGRWPECGADDDQSHLLMKVVPVTCRYAGSDKLAAMVERAIRVHQNNDRAVAFGVVSSRILEAVLLGAPTLMDALSTVERNMEADLEPYPEKAGRAVMDAFAYGKARGLDDAATTMDAVLLEWSHEVMKGKEGDPFYDFAGRNCAMPGAFLGPVSLMYRAAALEAREGKDCDVDGRYVSAVRENILASGDTCSRAVYIGAVMAAAASGGTGSIPPEWIDKMDADTLRRVDEAIEAIASANVE